MSAKSLLSACILALSFSGIAHSRDAQLDLVEPIAEYKLYVLENLEKLVEDTQSFTAAVKAGDVAKAKSLFASTRLSYERIEPIAELFSDLDVSIDSRADDHEKAEADPAFTGFHRIEYGLWVKNATGDLVPFADKLMSDVSDLHARVTGLTLPPDKVVGGAAVLMEEIAATKISGEEDRYSHTDLWDFRGNIDGAHKILELVRPLIAEKERAFLSAVDANFARVNSTLDKYREGDGYASYEKLSDADRKVLAVAINALAEDLSKLRGKLGLD